MLRVKDILKKFKPKSDCNPTHQTFRGHGYFFNIGNPGNPGPRGAWYGGYWQEVLNDKAGLMNCSLINNLREMREKFSWLFIHAPTLCIDNFHKFGQVSQLTPLTFNDPLLTPDNVRASWPDFIGYCDSILGMPVLLYSGANGFNRSDKPSTEPYYDYDRINGLDYTEEMINLAEKLGARGVGLDAIEYVDSLNGYDYSLNLSKRKHTALLYEDKVPNDRPERTKIAKEFMQMHIIQPSESANNTMQAIINDYPSSVNFLWRQWHKDWNEQLLAKYRDFAKANNNWMIDFEPKVVY